jgi:hypothetical protein
MKKGKANVPPQMRSQYARAQEMENYRQQMMESQRMGADGLPVFNLYVRTSLKNVSYVACCLYLLLLYYYDIVHYGDNIPCNHRVVTSNLRILTSTYFLLQKQLATTQYYYSTKIIINYIRTYVMVVAHTHTTDVVPLRFLQGR